MLSVLFSIWLVHTAILISPGVNFILLSQFAASDESKSHLYVVFGICVGTFVWAISAVLGVHALFLLFPSLRLALQITGGIYLLYIAAKLWRSGGAANMPQNSASNILISALAAFRLGFLTNITNPKPAIFFSSVFAASFPAVPGLLLQTSAIVIVVTNSLLWHLFLGYMFSRPSIRTAYAGSRSLINRISGAIVGALGISLLVSAYRETRI
jgi:threonine efflux protein